MTRSSSPGLRYGLTNQMVRFFSSKTFFGLVVAVFVVQAAWIALTARYPQAFDEQFHFGIIRIYAQHLSPLLAAQPPDSAQYGALVPDPSYLYHYLMSFPYRLIAHLTASQTTQVIALRLINIALLACSLFIFKKVLRKTPVTEAMSNLVLAFLVLLPVFPLLGSQINYDNLLIPLSGAAVYWLMVFLGVLRERGEWHWGRLVWLAALCVLTSLVKYPFLPIFVAMVLIVGLAWLKARKCRLVYKWPQAKRSQVWMGIGGVLLLVSIGLFWQRDGVNVIKYGTPIPECNQVLSVKECQAYSPWARNWRIAHDNPVHPDIWQIVSFPGVWTYHIMGELVFTISSSFNDTGAVDYHTGQQFILVEVMTWGIFGMGVVLVLWRLKSFWRQPTTRVFMIISGLYLTALFGQNLIDYINLGQPLAIHGRYLFPVLPLLFVLVALGFREALGRLGKVTGLRWKSGLAATFLALLLFEGGGFVTYILRSDPSWFWPQSSTAKKVNSHAKKLLKPVVVDVKR